jgi:aryl carrier-like protein
VKIFDASSAYEAFKYMQSGQHIGRICISVRDASANVKLPELVSKPVKSLNLNEEASYLLVGGLGGLGRAVSTWMLEYGARHLIFLSRNAGTSPEDRAFINELGSMGCNVQIIRGSVTNLSDVVSAVNAAKYPLKGVLQMSMVLCDDNFFRMSYENWLAATSPKIQGTWNLHDATKDCQLDFFILFSSVSGLIGQPGQINYATGNAFLDAFVKFRKSNGLPASAIDIGPVADVGYLVNHQDLFKSASTTGFKALNEQKLLDALRVAINPSLGVETAEEVHPMSHYVDLNTFVLGLGSTLPLDHPSNRAVWRNDTRFAAYHNITSDNSIASSTDNALKEYLSMVKADTSVLDKPEAGLFLAGEIGKRLFTLLMKPEEDLNPSSSLSDLGLDSLVGIELRAWWKQVFGFDTSVLEMLGMATLEALGQHAAKGLFQVFSSNK